MVCRQVRDSPGPTALRQFLIDKTLRCWSKEVKDEIEVKRKFGSSLSNVQNASWVFGETGLTISARCKP